MWIRLAAQEHMLPGTDLVEKFEFTRSAGFDGIELLGKGDGVFASRREELESARDAGVVMPSVCVQMDHFIGDFDPHQRADARATMKDLLSTVVAAGGFGAITPAAFGLFSRRLPPFTPPRSPENDRAVLLKELTALGEHAAQVGATVLLEPLNRYEDHVAPGGQSRPRGRPALGAGDGGHGCVTVVRVLSGVCRWRPRLAPPNLSSRECGQTRMRYHMARCLRSTAAPAVRRP